MWALFDKSIDSRLLLGTAQYPSLQIMQDAIKESAANIVTVSLKRQLWIANTLTPCPSPLAENAPGEGSASTLTVGGSRPFWDYIKSLNCHVLPNTAGCRNAEDAVTTAEMAREIFQTNWVKLEVIGDDYNLQPDPFELLKAASILNKKGFDVFPYCTDDLVLCQRLLDSGCKILMPWAAPIGSGKGIVNPYALQTLRERLPDITMIIDAGIGKPSHATAVMEMGFDGVLLNTAVSLAKNPVKMAGAFRDAIKAGYSAYQAGLMAERNMAHPSTPILDTPFWHTGDA